MRSMVYALILMAVVTGPAWAHDPSCITVYSNTQNNQGVPIPVGDGAMVLDDVHLSVPQAVLCAVDVRGAVIGPGTLSLYVYKGSPTNDAPTTLLAGPIDMSPPPTQPSATFHFEVPATAVDRDLWIGVGWTGPDGTWVGSQRTTPSVGTSDDIWWESYPGQTPQFYDGGDQYTASTYLVVYANVPTPTQVSTWGEVKATYR